MTTVALYDDTCIRHDRFTPVEIESLRNEFRELQILDQIPRINSFNTDPISLRSRPKCLSTLKSLLGGQVLVVVRVHSVKVLFQMRRNQEADHPLAIETISRSSSGRFQDILGRIA